MIDEPSNTGSRSPPDKVRQRREAKVAAIVESAWMLAREHGIAGLSLHALAREVGMRQPSLYAYFDSKLALYDAMFADGNRRLLQRLDVLKLPRDPRAALKRFMALFVAFALEDSRLRQRPTSLPRRYWDAPTNRSTKPASPNRVTSTASWPWWPA
jgi:AcrR family transcriptional regulator